ncbi:MAG: UDP-N-acetylmuramoyl-L-alanine--D-glutamate ligase [Burkholderiales bacterium]|nr:UDP-N-acetylmuramoyl-L-alanine--D-glutamate ligase [Burkholderiales bacterium]
MDWHGKKILVLGLGDTGLSVIRWAARAGARVRVADSRSAPPGLAELARDHAGVDAHLGPFTDALFGDAELTIASPGVAVAGPACDPAIARAKAAGQEIIGDVELFGRLLQSSGRRNKVIGITGSNGKSTVTAMAGAMCRAAGLRTVVAGNIGTPVLDALHDAETNGLPDAWVLELSSFQLETMSTLKLDAAAMLNLSQDHLDRYATMADYAAAKQRIFANAAAQVLNREDPASMAMRAAGKRVLTFGLDHPRGADEFGLCTGKQALCADHDAFIGMEDLPLPGLHNAANAMAAVALCRALDLPLRELAGGLRDFKGLPHRTERVGEVGGVRWYDDSKGTNVGATVAALNGMTQPVVLIAGGVGKDQDFSPLRDPVLAHARAVVLIGRDAPKIEAVLAGQGVALVHASSMEDAVRRSAQLAQPGDAVLLSPACASFDMFENYKQRGRIFAACVAALGAQEVAH